MRTYRFESFDSAHLRFYDPDGRFIESRPLAGISEFIDEVETGYATVSPNLERLGRRLYEWLDGPTERWMEKVLPGPQGVAVNVDVAEGLRHLPWELLMRDGVFLCANATRPFTPVRRVSQDTREVEPANRPLRVLFMACAPEHVDPPLDYEGEERVILEATRNRPIELVVEESGSLTGLREQMEWYGPGYFDVFHLTGHADARDGKPRFVMEDELGFRYDASAEEVAEAFSGNWPRLVFLSGCRTGQAPARGTVPSMAEALVRAGAPAVLGWALPVGDVSASRAAASLYEHLAVGKTIDEAIARARRELLENRSAYWHLLRLYADATPLLPIVTPLGTRGRAALPVREASSEFLDAGKVEVCPRDRFVGRRRAIQRCLRVLRSVQGQDDYAEGVLLHGMGGLGKSSLAARLCDRMHDYRRVVMVGRLDEDGFLRAFSSKLEDPDAIATLQQAGLPLQQRLRRVLHLHLSSTPHLFVFDDFERSLDETGTVHVLMPAARDVLVPLLAAIREANSTSRVIVTSRYTFPLAGPARLVEQGLETMRGAELEKKTSRLEGFTETRKTDPDLFARARTVGAGNPRLLDRLDAVLADAGTDASSILSALEAKSAEFREELLLSTLLAQQEPAFRRFVALASIYDLPVGRDAIEAVAGTDLAAHLERAVGLSLVDRGHDPEDGTPRYYVSELVGPLVQTELDDLERRDAQARTAEFLYHQWAEDRLRGTEPLLLEIHRLAMAASLSEIAVAVADLLANAWINRSRIRDAEVLSSATLVLGEDFRILHNLARAEQVLGKTTQAREHYQRALACCPTTSDRHVVRVRAAIIHNLAELVLVQGGVKRALELYQESLSLEEQIGNVQGKAATLHSMAVIHAQQGEVKRALELYQESLSLSEQIGNPQGKAATLHQMAGIHAQQGEVKRALELYQESLSLKEQIGNVQGKAATLHGMAVIHAQQGEVTRALELYQESLSLEEQIGNVRGKAATLHAMAVIHARQGEVKRALELYHESLSLKEQIGDVQGKAATLHQMAGIHAQQGEVKRALELYQESLSLKGQIGDVQGKAATLHQMAVIYEQQGEMNRALQLYEESLSLEEQIGNVWGKAITLAQISGLLYREGKTEAALAAMKTAAGDLVGIEAWADLSGIMANVAVLDGDRAAIYFAQALWLAVRVEVSAELLMSIAGALVSTIGQEIHSTPLIAGGTLIQVTLRTERHPDAESLRAEAFALLAATAGARGINEQKPFGDWIRAERLLDVEYVLPRVLLELESLVPEGEWLFDRSQVGAA